MNQVPQVAVDDIGGLPANGGEASKRGITFIKQFCCYFKYAV